MMDVEQRCYLYAILAAAGQSPELPLGLFGAPIWLVTCRSLAAAVSSIGSRELAGTAEQVWCHEQVVERLMLERAVLPVRFGTVLSSENQVRTVLSTHYAALMGDLDRLDGQVELGLRICWAAQEGGEKDTRSQPARATIAEPTDQPGTRYLQARLREQAASERRRRAAQEIELWCRESLASCVGDMVTRVLATDRLPLSAALLVPKAHLPAAMAALTDMERFAATKGWRLVCTGPWPPYNFVTRL